MIFHLLQLITIYQYFFGEEDLRYGLREDVKGNKLAKSPEFTADINLTYETTLASGNEFSSIVQFIRRGDFEQRVSNNSLVDSIDAYNLFNVTASIDFVSSNTGIDFMLLNIADKDGINSSMTDVFGVAATGLELIPPRQFMVRLSMSY